MYIKAVVTLVDMGLSLVFGCGIGVSETCFLLFFPQSV